jgi:uncharacterized membrane protein/3-hydroxymyristoyl/3-hydroxydecanoyl-(acyl carrier protein) dehydratase
VASKDLACYEWAVTAERRHEPAWMRVSTALSWALAAASPFVLYFAITKARIEDAVVVLFAFAVLRALPAALRAERKHLLAALRLPLVAVLSAAVGLVTREPRALLALPSASQLAFGAVFLASLRGTPLVEHFARMKTPVLGPAHVRYCRKVTIVWGVTLTVAALAGFALAAWAPLEVWTVFTGIGAYVLIAVLFAGEYVTRKARFREYGRSPLDRALSRIFPPRGEVRELDLKDVADGRGSVAIPPEYVFFRGHFDRLPILPGIAQLTEIVLPLVRQRHPALGALVSLRRVRFRRPVFPGETLRVDLHGEPPKDLRFELAVGKDIVASGSMTFDEERAA